MYQVALRTARNAIIHHTGGVSNRAGTLNIGPVKDHTTDLTRLFDFQFNTSDQYALVFGDQYMWVIRNDLLVTNTGIAITGATQANPVVITNAGHTYSNGDTIFIEGTTMELVDQVTGVDIDGTGYTAWSSGGTTADIFELTTPYLEADLAELNLEQSADTITICHDTYAPRDLTRTGHNSWSLDVITFLPGTAAPTGLSVTVNTAATSTVRYKVTALAEDTLEESLSALNTNTETITGVTQANPAVVTSAAHPYVDLDEIEISGIVGMTELNGRRFRVNVLTASTYELIGEDSTNHTAYVSGGSANRTFYEITTSGATPDNTISWTGVTGAVRYVVYRNDIGAYGSIGETEVTAVTDVNISLDLTIAPPQARNPFLFTGNYPRCSSYYEQRQVYGSTANAPDTTWYSRTGARKNMSTSTPSQADDSITATLTSRQVNEIRNFVPGNDLLVMTSGGEWRINSGGNNAFEAATLRQKPQSEWGSSHHRPLSVGNTVMFIEENNARIRSLGYSLNVDGYTGSDMTLLADHLLADDGPTKHTVVDWALSHYPEPRFHVVRSDGQALTMTFNQEQEVIAWTTWDTQGAYEATTSLKKAISSVEDGVYFIVKRIINGNTVRHIERQHTRKFPNLQGAYFVDDGVTYDGNPQDIEGVTFGSIVITITGHTFNVGDTVYLDEVQWLCDTDNGQELDTDFLNGTTYIVSDTTANTITLSTLVGAVTNNDVEPDFARNVTDITFNDDGLMAYVTGDQGGINQDMETKQYVLSTAYDFTTAAATSGTIQWSSSSSKWSSRMLWDDKGYRAVQWEMRTGPTAAEFIEYDAGDTPINISAVTNADPGVVTTAAVHGLTTGDVIIVKSVGGMTQLNDNHYKVVVLTTTTFELQTTDDTPVDVDTTAFGVYTSGGTITEITPYDVTVLTANGVTKDITSDISFDLTFGAQTWRYNGDGTAIYAIDQGNSADTTVKEYALTTPYDLSTMSTTLVQSISLPADKEAGRFYADFDFCNAGTEVTWVYEGGTSSEYATYTLSTAYDLSTIGAIKTSSFTDEITIVDPDDGPRSITYADNGTRMYTPFMRNGTTTEDKHLRQFDLAEACEFPEVIDTSGYEYFGGGTLSDTATVVDVPHLDGETVCVVADGVVTCGVTVTDRQVTSARAGRIHVGLPYTTDIETLNITASDGDAQQGRIKSVSRVVLRFFKSLNNCYVGPNSSDLTQMDVNELGDSGEAILIGDGEYEDHEIFIEPVWNSNGRIFIRQTEPSPLTILAIIPEFETEDDQQGQF
jgi:hypothetical protein